ncbi:hypothetical protein [Rhizobium leguminosarum]|uniref:hypothetical protein n=1 Tax=Rhizobium leguminosarum TaxID=384 RepID=UPI001AEB129A|nr:hypothetical protein [Rhizobium leguminosarum]MBP2446396.1 hypothetical protein [Rhizobium leguminosarum]
MFVKGVVRRQVGLEWWAGFASSVVVIAYGFLTPEPFHLQMLFAMTVALVIQVMHGLRTASELHRDEVMSAEWRGQLALRLGMERLANEPKRGIDWEEIRSEVTADVKAAIESDHFDDQFKRSVYTEMVIHFCSIPLSLLFRPLLGWWLAQALLTYAPRLVVFLTTGVRI